jgi:hypothetical protein
MGIRISSLMLLLVTTVASAQSIVPCDIVVPVLDANHQALTVQAPDGHPYPVFQAAPPSELVDAVRRELETSLAQQVLRLDRYARDLMIAKLTATPGDANREWLTSPMFLLMSAEEGGFARFGFWLQDATGKRRLALSSYVDMVVTNDAVETGDLEEIFSHELGHLILKTLTGGMEAGQSRKMHQSMTVTDYPTAFDEGYAEHFQPLARDATKNVYLRKLASGAGGTDLEFLWLSAADGQLRTDGVKRNLFIHRKPLTESAFDATSDLYRLFVEAETSTVFLPTELKNGQQMMASEGVIATLFYRFANNEQLRSHYRESSFYRPFLPGASDRPENLITPAENVNLKLFAAMAALRGIRRDQPPMISLVEQYAKLFPDEAKRIYAIFIETTWGATVSQQLVSELTRTAEHGRRGDMAAFRQDHPFPLLDSIIAEVAAGKRALDDNLGPEIWILNSEFKIASPVWTSDRRLPCTINLNTATEPELMTIPGVDLVAARKTIAARSARGFFRNIHDLNPTLSPEIMRRLNSMSEEMKRFPSYQRD